MKVCDKCCVMCVDGVDREVERNGAQLMWNSKTITYINSVVEGVRSVFVF